MAYKYQEILKKVYEFAGNKWVKTPVLHRARIVERGDLKLAYIKKKGLIEEAYYAQLPWNEVYFEDRPRDATKSDKLSAWWKITNEGLVTLADVFGIDLINKDDLKPVVVGALKKKPNGRARN
jgi:hypothetical protein